MDSKVPAVSIGLLTCWSIYAAFEALWTPFFRVLNFLVEAVAIMDIPYFAKPIDLVDRFLLVQSLSYVFATVASYTGAWLLARLVYGDGPIGILKKLMVDLRGEHA